MLMLIQDDRIAVSVNVHLYNKKICIMKPEIKDDYTINNTEIWMIVLIDVISNTNYKPEHK